MMSYPHAPPLVEVFAVLGGNYVCGRVACRPSCFVLRGRGGVTVSVMNTKDCSSHRHFVVLC